MDTCEKFIITTLNDSVVCSRLYDCEGLFPCEQEEADTRSLLHLIHCYSKGFIKVIIRTIDTDIVVLKVALFEKLDLDEIWIAFFMKKHFHYITGHEIYQKLGNLKSKALLVFHAISGCDVT